MEQGSDFNVTFCSEPGDDVSWSWLHSGEPLHNKLQERLEYFCWYEKESVTFEGCTLHWPGRISYLPGRPHDSMADLRFWVKITMDDQLPAYAVFGLHTPLQCRFLQSWPDHTSSTAIAFKPDPDAPEALRDTEEFELLPEQAFALEYWLKNGPHHDVAMGVGDDNSNIPISQWDDYSFFVIRYGDPLRIYEYTNKSPDPKIFVL